MGDASYALYLTHTIVMEIYVVGRNMLVGDQVAILDPSQSLFAAGAMLVLCSVVAIAVHLRIELPMLRWLRRKVVPRADRPRPPFKIDAAEPPGAASRSML
jgi:peptidoglycan/LPS O-acetylase OafA/YrhL